MHVKHVGSVPKYGNMDVFPQAHTVEIVLWGVYNHGGGFVLMNLFGNVTWLDFKILFPITDYTLTVYTCI